VNGKKNIESFIPQRPPFVFIDTIESVEEKVARTRFTIPAECPLVADNILPLSGLMENAAQTCATRAGDKIGYIGAIKQMQVKRFPHVGETLTTEAVVVQEVLNISLMECTTRIGNELIATTTLKIATIE
jgi:predicted hotdog family 3-hydroxylacyl-ACP dehydratase